VAEALSWVGTPFHDCAGVKGHGTDCVHLLIAVFANVGVIERFDPAPYRPQWFQHRDEPKFLDGMKAQGARQIDPAQALPGDVLMYNYGRHAAHGAIVIDEHSIVHAYKPAHMVVRSDRGELAGRLDSAWTLFA